MVKLEGVQFTYPAADTAQLAGVNCKLCLNSRVAITGGNGAGKTTLLRVLVGEMEADKVVWAPDAPAWLFS